MTAQPDSYVKVYYSIVNDAKFAGMKLETLGAWLRLLIAADAMYPSSAPFPRWLSRRNQDDLTTRGLIDAVGDDHYVVHGMEAEREKRAAAARVGGLARANAERTLSDRSTAAERSVASPLRSPPLPSTPTSANAGLPHISEEVQEAGEAITGHGILTAGEKQLTELDRLIEAHGSEVVKAALIQTAKGESMSWRQLVWGTMKRLEPIPAAPTVADTRAKEQEEAEKRRWAKSMEANRRRAEELSA